MRPPNKPWTPLQVVAFLASLSSAARASSANLYLDQLAALLMEWRAARASR